MTFNKSRQNATVLKSLLKLYLVFGGMIILFVVSFHTGFGHRAMVIPLTYLAATCSGWIMNLWGAGAIVIENTLMTSQYSINVVDGCNGVYATAILISGIVAYPSKIKHKALGALLGVIAIFIVNLVRVISLFYFGQHYPDIFREAHVYVWQPIIILWAIYIWDFWRRKIASR